MNGGDTNIRVDLYRRRSFASGLEKTGKKDRAMNAILKITLLTNVFFILLVSPNLFAADIQGVTFRDTINTGGIDLEIRGTGLYRHLVVIKAYVGALYMLPEVPSNEVLSDTPKRLEVEYFHAIKGEAFGAATNKVMARNVDAETFERLKPQVAHHNSLYRDVQPGDRYSLTYVPGRGTKLALNDEPLGIIEGAEFAMAIFSMWLGEQPMNKSFKKQLLRPL
jgi:hypothetical protein